MKYIQYILIVFALIGYCSCKSSSPLAKVAENESSLFKIKKIKEEKSLYIVYATRNDSIFKIIAEKKSVNVSDCKKIKKGGGYLLDLEQIFPTKFLFGEEVIRSSITGMGFKGGVNVLAEYESHYSLYLAKNLDGLCICE